MKKHQIFFDKIVGAPESLTWKHVDQIPNGVWEQVYYEISDYVHARLRVRIVSQIEEQIQETLLNEKE